MEAVRGNGYRGEAFREVPLSDPPPENGLVRLYIGPGRQGGKIHLVHPTPGKGLLCMPNVPVGRFSAQPDATEPECGRCIYLKSQREGRPANV